MAPRRATRGPGPATRPGPLRPAPLRRGADDPAGGWGSVRSRGRAIDVLVVRGDPRRGRPARPTGARVHDRAGPRDRAPGQPASSTSTSTSRSTTRPTREPRSSASAACATTRRSRSRPGSMPRSSTPATSSARRSSVSAVADRDGGRAADHRLLGRPRPDRDADPARPHGRDRRRLRPRRVDVRRPRARAAGESIRVLAETVRLVADSDGVLLVPSFAIGRTQEVVWELDRLIERRARSRCSRCTSTRRWRRRRPTSTALTPTTTTRRRAICSRDGDESPLDYPNQIITNDVRQSQAIARAPAAVHDRRLERDAHRRPGRRPPAQPDRRPGGRAPVRRLPGRGHARRRTSRPGRRPSGSTARSATCAARCARSAASRAHADESELLDWLRELRPRQAARRRRASRARSSSSTATPTRRPRSRPKVRAPRLRRRHPALARAGRARIGRAREQRAGA